MLLQQGQPCHHSHGTVKQSNFDCYGEIYDKMRAVKPEAENAILHHFTHTSQHAALQHSENVGALVARVFVQTSDLEMEHVKELVFRVSGGPLIMAKDHPALQELFKTCASDPELQSTLLYLLLKNYSQCLPFCMQTRCLMELCSRRLTPRRTTRSLFWAQ